MSEVPTRLTVRGGRDQFQWDSVKEDRHYQNYLGHSLKAPTGRWQRGKDLEWFNKPSSSTSFGPSHDEQADREGQSNRHDELRMLKEAEREAVAQAMGVTLLPPSPPHQHLRQSSPPSVSNGEMMEPGTRRIESVRGDDEKRRQRIKYRSRERRRSHKDSGRHDTEGSRHHRHRRNRSNDGRGRRSSSRSPSRSRSSSVSADRHRHGSGRRHERRRSSRRERRHSRGRESSRDRRDVRGHGWHESDRARSWDRHRNSRRDHSRDHESDSRRRH